MMNIEKYSPTGILTIVYTGQLAEILPNGVVLHAQWERTAKDLGYTTFAPGDRFTEYFYTDQWFNIMQVEAAATGLLRGWYCNIARPATVGATIVSYVDLYVDVWIQADGTVIVLDEDEFAAATDLSPAERNAAQMGLVEVLRWAAHGLGPLQRLHTRRDR